MPDKKEGAAAVSVESRRPRIYVAGPYTVVDPVANTHRAIEVGDALWDVGFAPFVPHLNLAWHLVAPRAPETWYALDLEWLAVCDVVVRIPGRSPGAEKETSFALDRGIPVVELPEDYAQLARDDLLDLLGRLVRDVLTRPRSRR